MNASVLEAVSAEADGVGMALALGVAGAVVAAAADGEATGTALGIPSAGAAIFGPMAGPYCVPVIGEVLGACGCAQALAGALYWAATTIGAGAGTRG